MKLLRKFSLIILLGAASSCAFFNDRTVDVSINSNPAGADIFIEGRHFGKTPTTINIEPRKYTVTLTKEGYGSANFDTAVWGTIRTDVAGNRTGDGDRCLFDTLSVVFFFNIFTEKCADFKQKEYFITIPQLGPSFGSAGGSSSMLGLSGRDPSSMIGYYYNQDTMSNPYGSQNNNPYAAAQSNNPYGGSGSAPQQMQPGGNPYDNGMQQGQDDGGMPDPMELRNSYPR